jgi:hypothetical protein
MKNRVRLSIALTFFFSNIICLTANSWEKPKAAENLMYRIEDKINALQKEKGQKQAKLEDPNTHLSDKQKDKITLSIKDLDSRLAELNTSKTDMDRLGNDKNHIYVFSSIGENGVTKSMDKEIVIHGANDALLIHEIRHISLWLQTGREFRFNKDNLLIVVVPNGSYDELHAYRAQYAFSPNSLPRPSPNIIEDITIEFVAKIRREDGTLVYPQIYKIWASNLNIKLTPNKVKESMEGVYTATTSH